MGSKFYGPHLITFRVVDLSYDKIRIEMAIRTCLTISKFVIVNKIFNSHILILK